MSKKKKKEEEVVKTVSPAEAEDLLGGLFSDFETARKKLARERYVIFQEIHALAKAKKYDDACGLVTVLMDNILKQTSMPQASGKHAKALEDLTSQLLFAKSKNMSRHRMRNHVNFLHNLLRQIDQALYSNE